MGRLTVSQKNLLWPGCQWSPDKDVELDELMELLDFLIDDGKTNQQNSSRSKLIIISFSVVKGCSTSCST